ncbi:hypothetical protein ACFLSJ_04060 [Verrucomicrobiota bacterium]
MRDAQKWVLGIGLVLFALAGLIPPCTERYFASRGAGESYHPCGHKLIFTPAPDVFIDVRRLSVEWFVIAVCTGGVWFLLGGWGRRGTAPLPVLPRAETQREHRPSRRRVYLFSACGVLVCIGYLVLAFCYGIAIGKKANNAQRLGAQREEAERPSLLELGEPPPFEPPAATPAPNRSLPISEWGDPPVEDDVAEPSAPQLDIADWGEPPTRRLALDDFGPESKTLTDTDAQEDIFAEFRDTVPESPPRRALALDDFMAEEGPQAAQSTWDEIGLPPSFEPEQPPVDAAETSWDDIGLPPTDTNPNRDSDILAESRDMFPELARRNWTKVRQDMSKAQVEELLGRPSAIRTYGVAGEWWEYGRPELGHRQARVRFSGEGRVIGWTSPQSASES